MEDLRRRAHRHSQDLLLAGLANSMNRPGKAGDSIR